MEPYDCHQSTRTPVASRIAMSISFLSSLSALVVARTKASKLKRKGIWMTSTVAVLSELIEPRDAHLDFAGCDGVDDVLVNVELALVEDFYGDCVAGAPLDLFLELHEICAEMICDRHLQCNLSLIG